MSDPQNENKNWWATLPGVLTSLATLLAALGGLYAVIFGPPAPHPPQPVTPIPADKVAPPQLTAENQYPPIQTASAAPKLSWERDKSDDKFHWHLNIVNGPVHNLDVESYHGVVFSYFAPGEMSSNPSLLSFESFPDWSSGSEENPKFMLDFTGVNKQLLFIADRFSEVVPSDDRYSTFQYFVYLLATYETDAGVKMERAWAFEHDAKKTSDIEAFSYKPKAISVKTYRGEYGGMEEVKRCKRFLTPTTDTDIDWANLIRKTCSY